MQNFVDFLEASPTAWHAVAATIELLREHGFQELDERDRWKLAAGKRYYITRNGSSICAFVMPKKGPTGVKLVGAHTDSPALRLKPNAEFRKENMIMLGTEIYGGPLLTSWLNRDLAIAGRIVVEKKGKVEEALVYLKDHPVVVPQLAVHLDRKVNDEGLVLNKQEHLSALAALDSNLKPSDSYLNLLLKQERNFDTLLSHDLLLVPVELPRYVGNDGEMLSAYRLDNLGSVHAALTALLEDTTANAHTIKMVAFWDNEEIGSNTMQGAGSPFVATALERIILAGKGDREDYLRLVQNSLCLSVDVAHALHPNYSDRHDPRHQPLLGHGIVLKTNAQQRYATNGPPTAWVKTLCKKQDIPVQVFAGRNDIPTGTTIGPIHATHTGMETIDIGYPVLSMHAARELAAVQDHLSMAALLQAFLQEA